MTCLGQAVPKNVNYLRVYNPIIPAHTLPLPELYKGSKLCWIAENYPGSRKKHTSNCLSGLTVLGSVEWLQIILASSYSTVCSCNHFWVTISWRCKYYQLTERIRWSEPEAACHRGHHQDPPSRGHCVQSRGCHPGSPTTTSHSPVPGCSQQLSLQVSVLICQWTESR